ncbi:MAG: response regulator [Chitinivibrionales bacterium]|nr:response regulator [Chitinivibrionales bacterium]MBD3394554.1 response regulator [Chitinivibrionales bacterium]
MTIATQKNTLGKTQAIHFAEAQSERWISWIRLTIASVFALISLYSFALGTIPVVSFAMQVAAAATMCIYSLLYLSRARRPMMQRYAVFVLAFLDVTVVSVILLAYSIAGVSPIVVHSAMFAAYFIPVAFTALHHKVSLSIFAGLLSALQYLLLCVLAFPSGMHSPSTSSYIYITSVLMLLIVSILSGLISRNNFLSVQRVVTSEVRYHNLVHRLPQMLFTLNRGGEIVWANMAAYSILGIPSKAVVGSRLRDHMVDPDGFKLDKFGTRGTFQIRDFNGNIKFVDCIVQPTEKDDSGASWEGSMTDVTERELALTQREEMSSRLFQYQKMESLSTLASGMAHDFNNILQTSYDIIDRVGKETKEDQTRREMMLISETLTDAKFLISELLAIGRKQPLDYTPMDLGPFIKEIVPHFEEQIGETYSVALDIADDPLWIQGDPNYLKRIFQNFFGNARDAMPDGGAITVEAFLEQKAGEASNVVVRFSDTGTGIPPHLLDKIFDPFFTTKKVGKGTGLGLALVRRVVLLHNGQIHVEKTGADGTTFRIEIPESESGGEDRDTKSILLSRKATRVLLLDDDPKIRDILKFFLTDLDYKVCEGTTMAEAERAIRRYRKDCEIAILDWKLGGENPRKVIQNLRAIRPDLVIIVVSGYPPSEKDISEMGIFRWFTKPYDKNRLDLEIQKALHLKERDRTGAT